MWVRFPDGDIRYGIYNGTSDLAFPFLLSTSNADAWDRYSAARDRYSAASAADRGDDLLGYEDEPDGEVFDVRIATNYGGGWSWSGRAAKNVLVDGLDPWGDEHYASHVDGVPDWVSEGQ